MIPGWSPIKIVQTVPVGCISRSQGQYIGFSKCNFQKSSCLKLQGPVLSYLIYNIIKRSSTKAVQIMTLGFSIIGSTVTFDLFLRWATKGPLGPLVYFSCKQSFFTTLFFFLSSKLQVKFARCFSQLCTLYLTQLSLFFFKLWSNIQVPWMLL